MKKNKMLAVLLTVLFLAPFFRAGAEEPAAFTVDDTMVLRGMDRSWKQGYTPGISKGKWVMVLPVRAAEKCESLRAELILADEGTTPFKRQAMAVSGIKEEPGVWTVRFSLALLADPKNADYPCVIRLKGKTPDGKERTADLPYTVQIRGCKENLEKTQLRIEGVEADLSVGEEGIVRVTLANPCAAADYENLEMKVTDAAGHILPRDAEVLTVGNLGIGESLTVEYPVTVTEKASVAPHVLKLEMNWTALGKDVSQTWNHTVSIRQEIRLEQGGLKMAKSVTAGDSLAVTLPLMNMGKADVVNVLATVSMPGISERQSVLVGTIQPGETKQAQLVLSPARNVSGDFSGTLTVECTDQDGNPESFCLPLALTVLEPVPDRTADSAAASGTRAEQPAALAWGLGGGCGLFLAAFLLQGIVLRRRIHHMEEEKL